MTVSKEVEARRRQGNKGGGESANDNDPNNTTGSKTMVSQEDQDFVKYVDNLERKRTADHNEQLAARLREEW